MDDLTHDLKTRAMEEGFDLVGVAEAGPAETAALLRRWLAAGMHGGMGYMERTRTVRDDPRQLLASCRSVVVFAMSYHTNGLSSQSLSVEGDPRVWISRYAWGRDYHKVIKKKLLRLGRWLERRRPGTNWRACVDTAPILEREWAASAGLGWIGKNSSLINQRFGSELFLGIVLTDVELWPDAPTTDHCGRCTACLDACPTHAFHESRILDARLCVGYLTVEHRASIPEPLHGAMGTMAAGCDICQEVCPWTIRAPNNLHQEYQPALHRFRPRLEDLERFDEDGFRRWRAGSPMTRIPFPHFKYVLEIIRSNVGGVIK